MLPTMIFLPEAFCLQNKAKDGRGAGNGHPQKEELHVFVKQTALPADHSQKFCIHMVVAQISCSQISICSLTMPFKVFFVFLLIFSVPSSLSLLRQKILAILGGGDALGFLEHLGEYLIILTAALHGDLPDG